MLAIFRRLRKDQSGVTAIEYGLIASLIAVTLIVGVTLVGSDINNVFQNVATNL